MSDVVIYYAYYKPNTRILDILQSTIVNSTEENVKRPPKSWSSLKKREKQEKLKNIMDLLKNVEKR